MLTAQQIIAELQLQPLPREGGFYRETYRSPDTLPATSLPAHYGTDKSAGTAIYYLLTPDLCSVLHSLSTDEIFHFYLGDPVHMLQLAPDGTDRLLTLGTDLMSGQRPQVLVPRGTWQGSFLAAGGSFALLGTTMAPGFDFSDYQTADRELLIDRYPQCADLIRRLTPVRENSCEDELHARPHR